MKKILQGGAALVIAIFYAVGVSASANAHTTLLSSTPSNGEELAQAPTSLEMEFGEPLISLGKSIKVSVTSPSGEEIGDGDVVVSKNHLSQKLLAKDEIGKYHVKYRVVAEDGHVLNGVLTYSIVATAPIMKPTSPGGGEYDARNDEGMVEGEDGGNLLVHGVILFGAVCLLLAVGYLIKRARASKR